MTSPLFRRVLFEPLVGSTFTVRGAQGATSTMVLDRVTAQPSPPDQEQYSLYFLAEAEVSAQQGMYAMHHDAVGDLNIFLVPVRQKVHGVEFEACFNNLVAGT